MDGASERQCGACKCLSRGRCVRACRPVRPTDGRDWKPTNEPDGGDRWTDGRTDAASIDHRGDGRTDAGMPALRAPTDIDPRRRSGPSRACVSYPPPTPTNERTGHSMCRTTRAVAHAVPHSPHSTMSDILIVVLFALCTVVAICYVLSLSISCTHPVNNNNIHIPSLMCACVSALAYQVLRVLSLSIYVWPTKEY